MDARTELRKLESENIFEGVADEEPAEQVAARHERITTLRRQLADADAAECQRKEEECAAEFAAELEAEEEQARAELAAALAKARAKAQETIAEYQAITRRDLLSDYKAEHGPGPEQRR
jgi:hypothetical protein